MNQVEKKNTRSHLHALTVDVNHGARFTRILTASCQPAIHVHQCLLKLTTPRWYGLNWAGKCPWRPTPAKIWKSYWKVWSTLGNAPAGACVQMVWPTGLAQNCTTLSQCTCIWQHQLRCWTPSFVDSATDPLLCLPMQMTKSYHVLELVSSWSFWFLQLRPFERRPNPWSPNFCLFDWCLEILYLEEKSKVSHVEESLCSPKTPSIRPPEPAISSQ